MAKEKTEYHEFPISHIPSTGQKTGTWKVNKPIVDRNVCIGCKLCQQVCPDSCIQIVRKKSVINLDYCKGCGICARACPVKAITMVKEEK